MHIYIYTYIHINILYIYIRRYLVDILHSNRGCKATRQWTLPFTSSAAGPASQTTGGCSFECTLAVPADSERVG